MLGRHDMQEKKNTKIEFVLCCYAVFSKHLLVSELLHFENNCTSLIDPGIPGA